MKTNWIQKKIIKYLESTRADGVEIAAALNIPIDVSYYELDRLIRLGVVRKEFVGLETVFILNENKV